MKKAKPEIEKFYLSTVLPAFRKAENVLAKEGRFIKIYEDEGYPCIEISESSGQYSYKIKVRDYLKYIFPYPEIHFMKKQNGIMKKGIGTLRYGVQDYDISVIKEEEIVNHLVNDFKSLFETTHRIRS
ncbi:MAG: hypothetical protein ACE144_13910 [Thermodesulfobacteriota bacterium]